GVPAAVARGQRDDGSLQQAGPTHVRWEGRRLSMETAPMSDVTTLLDAVQSGDPEAPAQLFQLVYDDLRRLAAHRRAHEAPGQTLEPTALVHEAYLRLVGDKRGASWDGRDHFFAAAAEAMRRILVEHARSKHRLKRGGDRARLPLEEAELLAPEPREDVLALDEAL